MRYVDRELLRLATEYLHAHQEENPADSAPGWLDRCARYFGFGNPDCNYTPPPIDVLYEGDFFRIQQRLLSEIAAAEDAVIVGRGAAQTLKGRAGVISVFLHAPEARRVERVRQVYGMSDERAAATAVRESDRERAHFVRSLGEAGWTDARAYDLALDTAALGFDGTIALIVSAAQRGHPT